MEKKQKTSLTWQLILTMVVIVAGTVAMCWYFNTTFLEKYYRHVSCETTVKFMYLYNFNISLPNDSVISYLYIDRYL